MINLVTLSCCLLAGLQNGGRSGDSVIATAGEHKITEAHLQLTALLSGHSEITPKIRAELTKRLVETRYVTDYLKRSGVKVNGAELALAGREARARLKAKGVDLRKRMKMLKLSESDLRKELAIEKLWNRYRVKALTEDVVKARFVERKEQYDGTRVRASQIFLRVDSKDDAGWATAKKKLDDIRSQVVDGKLKFADAAKKHSQSPSGKEGGDVGRFPFSGLMPRDFSTRAFGLKKGEMSQPYRSRFGAHLLMATDRDPGNLSLEDARVVIYRELEREMWNQIVKQEKSRAPKK